MKVVEYVEHFPLLYNYSYNVPINNRVIEHLKKHLKFFSYNEEVGRTEIVKAVDTKLMKAKEDECVDQQRYQSAVGTLLYLSSSTRLDITYAVSSTVAKHSANPTKQHWIAVKLKETLNRFSRER